MKQGIAHNARIDNIPMLHLTKSYSSATSINSWAFPSPASCTYTSQAMCASGIASLHPASQRIEFAHKIKQAQRSMDMEL